jgi:DNA polymerase elongation subunit (family B)
LYQGIYYDYFTRTCHLRDDVEGWCSFEYYPTAYRIDDGGEFETLDGKRCVPVKGKIDKNDPTLYEKDVDINLRILLDLYMETDDVPQYHNKVFLDIETVKGGAINLPYCQKAPAKVTAIALYDTNTKDYYCYVLDEKSKLTLSEKNGVKVIPCSTEFQLLKDFLIKWEEIDPTIVITWNGDGFDIPYLYNRIKRILGEDAANSLSPINVVTFDEWDEKMPYKIAGVTSMDYMRLYKKFIPKQQPSYGLDFIGKKEVGKGKIFYEGSLDSLFEKDIDKFIDYNVNDVRLIVEIDEKRKFLDLAIMVAHMSHVPYHYVYQSSRVVEGVIMTYLKRKGIVSPNKPTTVYPELKAKMQNRDDSEDEDEKFPGAYVKDPIPGLYTWNIDCDLESLYPSIIRNLNIGTDSYVGKIVTDDIEDLTWGLDCLAEKDQEQFVTIQGSSKKMRSIKVKDLITTIKNNNLLISPNGAMFSSSRLSIVNEVVTDWFFKRKDFKTKMIKYGSVGDKKMYEFYDLYQQVMKVFLNSIYGCLGLVSFRYTDADDTLAIAVTLTGRDVNISSMKYTNDKLNAEMGTDEDYILMADTDSMFISVTNIIKHRIPDIDFNNDEETMKIIRELAVELPKEINDFYRQYSINRINRKQEQYFKTKSETIGKRLYISAKKQYAQFIVEKEGVVKQEFDFKGLDFMKSSFPPLFREFTQNLVKNILFDKKKTFVDNQILEFRERFKSLPFEEVAKPTGVNKELSKYIARRPTAGNIFSLLELHTPVGVKASIYYNDLLKFKNKEREHSIIQAGDKIKWVYLKDNPYKISVIAINVDDTCDEIFEYAKHYMDKKLMFEKNLQKKLQKIYDNLGWGIINYNKNVSRFFKPR